MRSLFILFLVALMNHSAYAEDENSRTYEQGGVRIKTTITAHLYEWQVTNIDAPPIMKFQVETPRCYSQRPPDGWEWSFDTTGDEIFYAWTDDPQYAIRTGQTSLFTARLGSAGGILGQVDAMISFDNDQAPVVFHDIWGPVPKPVSLVITVAITIAAIALFHVLLVGKILGKKKRA